MRARRWAPVALSVALLTACACARAARTDEWPAKPVRLIVPWAAGTGSDLTARLFAERLAERWRRAVVVDNRPGTDALIGVQAFVAATDRHTLLFSSAGPVTFAPLVHGRLPYDPVRDLVPISAATKVTLIIAATKALPVATIADLVRLVRSRPGDYVWAAVPGPPELVFSAFLAQDRLQMRHAAYRDMSTAVQDLGEGRVHIMVASIATISSQLQSGRVRLLAVTNSTRSTTVPDVPTVLEAGYGGLTIDGLWGFFGWGGMPETLRRRIAADIGHAAADPALRSRLSALGQTVDVGTPEQFSGALEAQRAQIAAVARAVGWKSPGGTKPSS